MHRLSPHRRPFGIAMATGAIERSARVAQRFTTGGETIVATGTSRRQRRVIQSRRYPRECGVAAAAILHGGDVMTTHASGMNTVVTADTACRWIDGAVFESHCCPAIGGMAGAAIRRGWYVGHRLASGAGSIVAGGTRTRNRRVVKAARRSHYIDGSNACCRRPYESAAVACNQ